MQYETHASRARRATLDAETRGAGVGAPLTSEACASGAVSTCDPCALKVACAVSHTSPLPVPTVPRSGRRLPPPPFPSRSRSHTGYSHAPIA